MNKIKKITKQIGQGMTEYIIIVALIAIAAITVYGFFGDTIRGQMGAMTAELGGQDGSNSNTAAQDAGTAGAAEGAASKDLTNFTEPGATE
jgi:Flp pilus assembly pilin Flp